mmetsp:Transcript_30662/g.85895  ORF Transcript_30662/g.85895 Transcript_30662/m.85895 type:complete len:81 (-) Transcript_30662:1298-1540(-)
MFRISRAMQGGLQWHSKVKNMKLTRTRKVNDKKRLRRERDVMQLLRMYKPQQQRNVIAQSNAFWDTGSRDVILNPQPKAK